MEAFTRVVLFRLIHRTIRYQGKNGPDRQRGKEPNCLEISVARVRPRPLVSGLFLIIVGIYQGCSVSHYTPNYRTPKENATDRHLELERDCVEITVMSCRPMSSGLGLFLIRVRIYQVVLFSYHIEL